MLLLLVLVIDPKGFLRTWELFLLRVSAQGRQPNRVGVQGSPVFVLFFLMAFLVLLCPALFFDAMLVTLRPSPSSAKIVPM